MGSNLCGRVTFILLFLPFLVKENLMSAMDVEQVYCKAHKKSIHTYVLHLFTTTSHQLLCM